LSAPDLLVIGGGIAGLTTALAAAERGMNVVLVHAGRPGEASRAAAGILGPSVEGMPVHVLGAALAARDYYPAFLAKLEEKTGIAVPLDRNGILELAVSDADLALRAARAGDGAMVLDATALAALEPALGEHPGGILHPDDGAVDNVALMRALELAAVREPRITRVEASIAAVDFQVGTAAALTTDGQTLHAPTLILAAGAWVSQIVGLPRDVPVRPLMGQLLRLDGRVINHVTYGAGGYLIPRGAGLVVGATKEDVGFETRTTSEGRAALLAIAREAAPALASARAVDQWSGLRPVTPDALPILGADPDEPALVYACGFSRNGILLAPWAGEQIAVEMTSERGSAALALFSIDRFGTPE
jgi:glycine oxidase ThiO